MANLIKIKRSNVPGKVPTTTDLELGELAVNTYDGKLYLKKNDGTESIVEIGTDPGAGNPVANNLYVAKNGSDLNDGTAISRPKLTIRAAVLAATAGTTIFVKAGDYTEINPIVIPAGVSIVGDNLRAVAVRPSTTNQDLFHLNNGCYLTGMTFRDHVSPAAAVAFPAAGAGVITTSPYVQNCSSITTTGTGMRVDGDLASGLRSMVVDAYTQYNQGGIGIHMLNRGYTQLVSVFTICCDIAFLCESGGFCSITNSNTSFGTQGLVADGVSDSLYSGLSNGIDQIGSSIVIDGLSQRPNYGDAVKFSTDPEYYTIIASTELVGGSSTITIEEEISTAIPDNTAVTFHQRSLISASSHTFEYVGTGNDISTALPELGGIPVQANEVIELNAGKVYFTSTDQEGDFRIGGDLTINRDTGTITGDTFDRSLFAVLTPYILAIEG
jgi:hypothetical protein